MRLSLVILACLATALGANLEETTDVPTSSLNVEDGNDQDLTPVDLVQDEGVENKSVEDSEIMDENEGVDLLDEDKDEGDQEDSDELETNPAEDESNVASEKSDDTDGDTEGTVPNDDISAAVTLNPDEDQTNENEHDAFSTSELDFGGSDSDSEVGDDQSDENFGVDGNERRGTEVPNSELENQDQLNEIADVEGSGNDDGVPDIQEENQDLWDESSGSKGKDEEIPFDQPQDVGETFPSSAAENSGPGAFAPTPSPTFYITPDPMANKPSTLRPTVPYVPSDDDPLKNTDGYLSEIEDWFSNESTIEEMEHDKSVIIALSVVFGVMFFFSVFVAYQMLENPDGCCASLCRITVACWCGLVRCICYPCRSICGCTDPSGGQHMMVPDDGHFTHDLELS